MGVVEVKDDTKIRAFRFVLAFLFGPPIALALAAVVSVFFMSGLESLCPVRFMPSSGTCMWEPRWIGEIPFGVFALLAAFLWVVLPNFIAQVRSRKVARYFFVWGAVVSIFMNYELTTILNDFDSRSPAERPFFDRGMLLAIVLVAISLLGGMLGVRLCDRRLARQGEPGSDLAKS